MNFNKEATSRIFLFLPFFVCVWGWGHEYASNFVEIKKRTKIPNPGALIFPGGLVAEGTRLDKSGQGGGCWLW